MNIVAPPDNAWENQVENEMARQHLSREQATDLVVINWLRAGDTRPLLAMLQSGTVLSPLVTKFLIKALQGHDVATDLSPNLARDMPFQLVAKPRNKRIGKPRDKAIQVRDRLFADNVDRLIKEGLTREEATARCAEAAAESGYKTSAKTMDRAYAKRGRHKPRT